MGKIIWETVLVKVKDLIPYEKNPRKIEPDRLQRLKELVKEFDVVEIPVINLDGTLITFHQRLKVLLMLGRGEEKIEVRKPNRQLNEDELKRYNLASNSHVGTWDFDILESEFSDIDLGEFDIELPNISDLDNEEETQASEESNENKAQRKNTNGIFVALTDEEYEVWCKFKERIGFGTDKKVIFTAIKIIENEKSSK